MTFLLMLDCKDAPAQRITVFGKTPIVLNGDGFLLDKMKAREFMDDIGDCPKQKVTPVYLAGNWIGITTTDFPSGNTISFSEKRQQVDSMFLAHYKTNRLRFKAFYTKTPIYSSYQIQPRGVSPKKVTTEPLLDRDEIADAMLKVGDFFFVDFLNFDTNELVRRYYIKRLKMSPKIVGYIQEEPAKNTVISLHAKQQNMVLLPDRKIVLKLKKEGLPDSTVRYDLENLNTHNTLHFIGAESMSIPKLDAETHYILRLHYSMQPESASIYYIKTKPYWYRTIGFYATISSVAILVIGLSAGFVFRKKVRLAQRKQFETEQYLKVIQAQLNPHFAFNALSSIQGLMNMNQIREANYYLSEFGLLLRQTLERSQQVFTPLSEELEMMKTYIGLEKLRFDFLWKVQLSPTLNTSGIDIPTLLLQPLIENAIKHGISELGNRGRLLIICEEVSEAGSFKIVIKDNGPGSSNLKNEGYGLKLTRSKIEAVNDLHHERKIDLRFHFDKGTEITLTFHHWIDD